MGQKIVRDVESLRIIYGIFIVCVLCGRPDRPVGVIAQYHPDDLFSLLGRLVRFAGAGRTGERTVHARALEYPLVVIGLRPQKGERGVRPIIVIHIFFDA